MELILLRAQPLMVLLIVLRSLLELMELLPAMDAGGVKGKLVRVSAAADEEEEAPEVRMVKSELTASHGLT